DAGRALEPRRTLEAGRAGDSSGALNSCRALRSRDSLDSGRTKACYALDSSNAADSGRTLDSLDTSLSWRPSERARRSLNTRRASGAAAAAHGKSIAFDLEDGHVGAKVVHEDPHEISDGLDLLAQLLQAA